MTTSHKARADTIERADRFASHWGLELVPRDDRPIEDLLGSSTSAIVMANGGKMHLATVHGALSAHLGTAYIRLKSLGRGESDPLVRAGEIQPGDHILDTTFGLGRDAVVAACASGETGQVTAIESSSSLFHLGQHGLADGPLSAQVLLETSGLTSAPIQLLHGDATSYLASAEADSVDVVLIDPMFEAAKTSDSGFELLRAVANPMALTEQWVEEARRVARRWVVVKTGASQDWFSSAGLTRVHSHSNANWWRA